MNEPREKLPDHVVARLLLHAEQAIHRHGWDQPALLATLEFLPHSRLIFRESSVSLVPNVRAAVEHLGNAFLEKPHLGQAVAQDIGTNFAGFGLVTEAWQQDTTDPKRMRELNESRVSLADLPGSKEVRMINVIDIWARTFTVHRVRGQKPNVFYGGNPGPAQMDVGGPVVEGLSNMVLGTVRQMSEYEHLLPDLEFKLVPRLEDTEARIAFRAGMPGNQG